MSTASTAAQAQEARERIQEFVDRTARSHIAELAASASIYAYDRLGFSSDKAVCVGITLVREYNARQFGAAV